MPDLTTDVEMKSVDSPVTVIEDVETLDKKDVDFVTIMEVREQIRQIDKGISTKENRFISRILRGIPNMRRRLNANVLTSLINGFYTNSAPDKEIMLSYVEDAQQMEVDGQSTQLQQQRMRTVKSSTFPLPPEVDAYIHLLIMLHLIDTKHYEGAKSCSDALMEKMTSQTRRSLDLIVAKCYFYHMRAYELCGKLAECRSFFYTKLRTATLRNDSEGQAVLINCLLRNYLYYKLYDQADKLVSKCVFPENASNNEWARFLYYMGRIKATRLEYSEAHTNLVQALRKAPQMTAIGFRQAVQKMVVVVELLLGDIPDRQVFRQATLMKPLDPYFQLTQAVRLGNLQIFADVLGKFSARFQSDGTYFLIIRLRHNVIKTGIRAIAASYSRITPANIARKLGLESAKDAECIVAKAIRDGVIEATLDPINGYMCTKEATDIYCTTEPQIAFHQRTSFCLDLHNQSVKAMRYPPKSYGKDLESAEERREREQQDMELAKEMAEEDDDGFP